MGRVFPFVAPNWVLSGEGLRSETGKVRTKNERNTNHVKDLTTSQEGTRDRCLYYRSLYPVTLSNRAHLLRSLSRSRFTRTRLRPRTPRGPSPLIKYVVLPLTVSKRGFPGTFPCFSCSEPYPSHTGSNLTTPPLYRPCLSTSVLQFKSSSLWSTCSSAVPCSLVNLCPTLPVTYGVLLHPEIGDPSPFGIFRTLPPSFHESTRVESQSVQTSI